MSDYFNSFVEFRFGPPVDDPVARLAYLRDQAQQRYLDLAKEQGTEVSEEQKIVIIWNTAHLCAPALAKTIRRMLEVMDNLSKRSYEESRRFDCFKRQFEQMESARQSLLSICETDHRDD